MHLLILSHHKLPTNAHRMLQPPLHQSMRKKRGTRIRHILGPSTPANLPQSRLDKLPRIRNRHARLPNFTHGGRNQVAQTKLDIHTTARKFTTESRRPMLQECLAARIRRQQRRRQPAAKTAHRENQPAFALHHARCHNLRDPECRGTINRNNVPNLLLRRLYKRDGDSMALSHIIYQNPHIEAIDKCLHLSIIAILVLAEVHGEDFDIDVGAGIFLLDFGGEGVEFRGGARDEEEVEAFLGELDGVFFAQAVRGAGYYCPGAFLAIFAELLCQLVK